MSMLCDVVCTMRLKSNVSPINNAIHQYFHICNDYVMNKPGLHYVNMPMQYAMIYTGCKNGNF